jgi:galactokinase
VEGPEHSPLEKSPPPKAVLARARRAFRDRFGSESVFAATAPGRVNLIGEHTDYNGGYVLPMAIDRVCVAAASPGGRAGRWRIHSDDLGQDAEFNVSRPLEPNQIAKGLWVSYLAGVAAQFQRMTDEPLPALDIAIASSVPVGSGLASSAALEVAVATLLEQVLGTKLEPLEKAMLCQRAEHEFAGVPCGLMDQLASVMGRAGHALLIDCREECVTPVRMPASDKAAVLIVDSGVRHALAGGEYAARREVCAAACAKLGVAELRDATKAALFGRCAGALTLDEERCATHVISENERVCEAAEALRTGALPVFGRLMLESHASLRDNFRVSCRELDALVEAASTVPGVYGARMTGAGFGGCIVVLAAPGAVPGVCAAIVGHAPIIAIPSAGATTSRR